MRKFNLSVSFLLSLAVVLSACSRIDLATSWADTYIANQLDKYFDINNIQSQFIKKNLKDDIQAIKKTIFPRAADELEKVQKEMNEVKVYNREMFVSHEKAMKDIFYSGLKIFEPSAVGFVSQLNEAQLNAFKKEFKSKTDDIQQLVSDPNKSRDKRYDKTKKYIEGWIGSLTNDQKKDLRNFCQLHLFPYREQILNREKLAREFLEMFPDMEKRKKYVSDLFLNYESLRDTVYAQLALEDKDKFIDLLVKIANNMTSDQRKHLQNTLKDRIGQLRDSAEGKRHGWF